MVCWLAVVGKARGGKKKEKKKLRFGLGSGQACVAGLCLLCVHRLDTVASGLQECVGIRLTEPWLCASVLGSNQQNKRVFNTGPPAQNEDETLALDAEAMNHLQTTGVAVTDDAPKYEEENDVPAVVMAILHNDAFADAVEDAEGLVGVVLDKTNFYAEQGGQVNDTGSLTVGDDAAVFNVSDCKVFAGYVLHIGRLSSGRLAVGDAVVASIHRSRRDSIMANHTATHMLNFGLRAVLGEGVHQRGSVVKEDKMTFDFSNDEALTPEELEKVEEILRRQISDDLEVDVAVVPKAQAFEINGLRREFNDLYPENVRVVAIGVPIDNVLADPTGDLGLQYSVELCGGTHMSTIGGMESFAIVGEGSIAGGIRRITAVTGSYAMEADQEADRIEGMVAAAEGLEGAELDTALKRVRDVIDKATSISLVRRTQFRVRAEAMSDRIRVFYKLEAARQAEAAAEIGASIVGDNEDGTAVVAVVDLGTNRKAITGVLNAVKEGLPASPVFLVSGDGEGTVLLAACPKAISKAFKAGDWIRAVATEHGCKGGGKPVSAQGGGPGGLDLEAVAATARSHADGNYDGPGAASTSA